MMFTPFIFKSFPVLIQKLVACRIKTNHFGRSTQNLFRFSTFCRNLIQFCHGRSREQCTAGRVLNACRKYNKLSVRCKRRRNFRSRIRSQSAGRTSISRHNKHICISKTIAGKSNLFTVRRPHRRRLIRILCSQLYRFSTLGRHFVNVALITKYNFFSVWRNTYITHP